MKQLNLSYEIVSGNGPFGRTGGRILCNYPGLS